MPNGEKKGITVKVDAELHAQVSQYIKEHNMTMSEFVALALDDELHPKNQMKEGTNMEKTRTIAFQVSEDLFQRIKDYLHRNNMSQKDFVIGLIEDELERDQAQHESENLEQYADEEQDGEIIDEQNENTVEDAVGDLSDDSDEDEEYEEDSEDELQDFYMSM